MPEFCSTERDGRILVVTMNRPEVLNAVHPGSNAELERVFDDFEADPELWVAILTGSGDRAFCSGNDLKDFVKTGEVSKNPKGFGGLTMRFDGTKPIIAAVNGLAVGGGFEIALSCDLIIAAEEAYFALPEPRVGLAALATGMQRLPRVMPLKHAMGILLTGRRVSAREGVQLGFVNEVVPRSELMAAARRWAEEILECAPLSVRATKDVAQRSLTEPSLEAACRASYDSVRVLAKSEDYLEGPRAFAEKRKPVWKGR